MLMSLLRAATLPAASRAVALGPMAPLFGPGQNLGLFLSLDEAGLCLELSSIPIASPYQGAPGRQGGAAVAGPTPRLLWGLTSRRG